MRASVVHSDARPPAPLAAAASAADADDDKEGPAPTLFGCAIPPWLLKPAITVGAGETFNRWLIPPAAVSLHMCIGSVYAWSVFNEPLTKVLGGVAPSAADWSAAAVVPTFATGICFLGLSAAAGAKFMETAGPRCTGLLAAACWGSGHLVAAAGVAAHSLPLLVGGYGVLGGIGLGLGYVTPVSTLMKWFPDRKGLAAGFAVAGFGGGAMVAAPLNRALMGAFYEAPAYAGPVAGAGAPVGGWDGGSAAGMGHVELVTDSETGRRFVESVVAAAGGDGGDAGGSGSGSSSSSIASMREAVVGGAGDLAALPGGAGDALAEGAYLVGTGASGIPETFVVLGVGYAAVMAAAAMALRVPSEARAATAADLAAAAAAAEARAAAGAPSSPEAAAAHSSSWDEARETAAERQTAVSIAPGRDVHIDVAVRTPQFWLLWAALGCNVSAGIGVIACASSMMRETFGAALPATVDAQFCTTFVAAISLASIAGRLGWGAVSDAVGGKRTYTAFYALGIPCFLALPLAAEAAGAAGGAGGAGLAPLAVFYGSTMVIFSMYGGGFATIPAYLADVFGTKFVGGIHGRLLTAWACAGLLGPQLVARLSGGATREAIEGLAAKADEAAFRDAFGSPVAELATLIDAKSVSIAKLMEIVPPGTVDPSFSIYGTSMQACAGILLIGLCANSAMRPVDPSFYMGNERRRRHEKDQ